MNEQYNELAQKIIAEAEQKGLPWYAGMFNQEIVGAMTGRMGKWINDSPYLRPMCSICKQRSWDDETDKITPYCPKCGAKMDL